MYASEYHLYKYRHKQSYLFEVCIFALALLLSACSTPVKQSSSRPDNSSLFSKSGNQSKLQQQLSRHFQSWQHTPYKLGGTSRHGIDCSGFVQVTYRDVFNKNIPRSTRLQGKIGQPVTLHLLKLGDLVFFRTGRRQRHVGIYVGQNHFTVPVAITFTFS